MKKTEAPDVASDITNAELRIDEYPFTIRHLTEDDGGGYLIEYPDFDVCIADGATPEEAIIEGKDALRSVILTLMEFGHPIPAPGSSVSVALPSGLHDRLTSIAEKRHVRPAEIISEALDKQEPAA